MVKRLCVACVVLVAFAFIPLAAGAQSAAGAAPNVPGDAARNGAQSAPRKAAAGDGGAVASPQVAAGGAQHASGQFDFYVLSLSWSPSFCAAAAERNGERQPGAECAAHSYSFIVHGLWPQYETGFPEYCQNPAPRLDRDIVSSMLDLMPTPHLIFTEWDRHGTCAGLSPHAYFETMRKARAAVNIPADYAELKAPLTVTPGAVADAFVKANPGLAAADIAIACDAKRLTEVRLCLARDFSKGVQFHACGDLARHGCRREQVLVPPPRGGDG